MPQAAPRQEKAMGKVVFERVVAALVSLTLLLAFAPLAYAEDTSQLQKDVQSAPDFRARVSAALALGKKKDVNAVPALVRALKDENGAVRAAAAAALGSIGDSSAIAPLKKARDAEKDSSVKQSMERALSMFTSSGSTRTKVIVSVTKFENKSGDAKASNTFAAAMKNEIAKIPGIEIASSDAEAIETAKSRKLPTIALDARLVQVQKSTAGADTAIAAKVELVIRKIPEQSLKATVKGDAKALMNSKSVKGDVEIGQLRDDAVKAAVKSALKGAPVAIDGALK